MTGRTKIIYCGLDLTAWDILSQSQNFNVVAVNLIPDFLEERSLNPVDALFKAVYRRRIKNLPAGGLSTLHYALRFLSTGIFEKYAGYLHHICRRGLDIVDFGKADEVVRYISQNDIAMIVVNNWWMLPDKIIKAPPLGAVNIHPSKLPQYRGSLPTLWTLKNNDAETSVSFIVLAKKMDSGGIIAQFPVALSPQETSVSLEGKIEQVLKSNLETTLRDYVDGKCAMLAQDEALASTTARYFDYMKIDWSAEKAREIADKINLYPYLWLPHRCWTVFGKRKILIRGTEAGAACPALGQAAGSFCVKGKSLYVRARDGILKVRLFRDIAPLPSTTLLIKRQGKFGEGP